MIFRLSSLIVLSTVLVWGCGKKKEIKTISVSPVSGKITFQGKLPEKAVLVFHPATLIKDPENRMLTPTAIVAADGTFKVGTYTSSDGAPPGEYSITVSWPTYRIEAGEEITGEDRLQNRYNDKSRPAAKFTVKEGENKIPDINLR